MLATAVVVFVPTITLLVFLAILQSDRLRASYLWGAIGYGMVVAPVPVWLLEGIVEGLAQRATSDYLRLFIQQVLGAAVVEELLIGLGVVGVSLSFRKARENQRTVVAAAVAVAVGFTTVENVIAVYAAQNPLPVAFDRLLTIPFGHVSLQLLMGYFAAYAILDRRRVLVYVLLMFLVPVAIHGAGDYTEALFQYEGNLAPGSLRTRLLFSCWILALFVYLAGAAGVVWKLNSRA